MFRLRQKIRPRNIGRLRELESCARHRAVSMVRMNFQIRPEHSSNCHSERSRGIPWQYFAATIRDPSTSLRSPRMTAHVQQKTRIEISIRVFQILPRRCRSGGSPVPFSNGWMTVAPASDFQSRPVIFRGRPSLLVLSNSGSGITPRNLEHRRVNVRSRNQNDFGTTEEPLVES